MAISEVNSLVDLLERATQVVFTVVNNYKQTSTEIQAFTAHVTEYTRDVKEWRQLLRKYPLRQDHPVITGLEEAVRKLEEQKRAVHAMDVSNCCLRFWKKALSPDDLIASLRDVDKAFQDVLASLHKEEILKAEERLLQAAVEKAPFSFSDDKKYVPVMETVQKVRKALEGAESTRGSSSHVRKVVLVHGASGEGKSTLAKFLALDYFKKSKGSPSSSDLCRFSDGVIFISCKEKKASDSFLLLQKLWEDLGYTPEAPPVRGFHDQSAATDTSRSDLDNLKRKLISLLRGKSILIILDDVSNRYVIEDLMMHPEESDVNYLITSQTRDIWLPDETVHIGIPSTEEGRKILANHIVGWNGKQFPPEVQEEIDSLVKEVNNHPLVIANLAMLVKCDKVSDLKAWIQLRKQLNNGIQAADKKYQANAESNMCIYGETYKHSALASLTMVMDQVIDKARSLLLMLAICTGQGVPENVLKLWFKVLHGPQMYLFSVAFEDLQARSLILITEAQVPWNNDPLNICSIHDLRRQLLRDLYEDAVENILEKLTGMECSMTDRGEVVSSGESDEDIVAALFFVYGDVKYKQNAQNKLTIHDAFLEDIGNKAHIRPYWLKFVMTIGQLLHPNLEEVCDWEKTAHGLAKIVILHFLEFRDLKDYPVSELLELSESKAFVVTWSALDSLSNVLTPVRIPMTVRSLAKRLRIWTDEPPVDVNNLLTCLRAFRICVLHSAPFAVVEDLPFLLRKLLQWSTSNSLAKDTNVALTLLKLLHYLCFRRSARVQLVAAGMLETLLDLLNSNQTLLEQGSKTFRRLACSDPDIIAKTILLPDILNFLVRILPLVPASTLESLRLLAWTSENADSIASHLGALDGIVLLLTNTSDYQGKAVFCLGQLASFPSTRNIIASTCPSAFQTLIQLLQHEVPPVLMIDIAFAVRDIVSDDTEFKLESSENFLAKVLEKLDILLARNVHVTVRSHTIKALEILASKQPICKCLEAHTGLLEQICRVPTFTDTTVECMEFVNSAIRKIFIEEKGLEESRKMKLVAAAVKMYATLLQDDKTKSEVRQEAAKGLRIICCRREFCSVVADTRVEQMLMIHTKKDSMFYISVEGAHIVGDIFFEQAKLTKVERAVFASEVMNFYVDFLIMRGCYNVQMQENVLQGIALLACWREIRQLLMHRNTIELLLGHVTERASPLVLICVAQIIFRVCCTDNDAPQRMTILTRTMKRYIALLTEGIQMELREAATESLLIFASKKEIQKFILTDESAVDLLLRLVRKEASTKTLHCVAYILQNILVKGLEQEEVRRMALNFMKRAVESFIGLLADGIPIKVQAGALGGLGRLAFSQEIGEITVAYPGALNQLLVFVRRVDFRGMLEEICEVVELVSGCQTAADELQEDMSNLRRHALQEFLFIMEGDAEARLQEGAAKCLSKLLRCKTNRELFASIFTSRKVCLSGFVDDEEVFSPWSMEAYTLIDPTKAGEKNLSSILALQGRCRARISLKQDKNALEDCNKALELTWRFRETREQRILERLLSMRSYIKAELGDMEGALEDLNKAVESVNQRIKRTSPDKYDMAFYLQERGILKARMLDYIGSMLDLNESLRVDDDYEVLKNRGYVKFCLGDEDGARFDAEQANSIRFRRCMFPLLGFFQYPECSGTKVVKYLEFAL